MSGAGPWIAGGLVGIFGILGLFVSSRAVDAPFAFGGWLMFFGALAYIFSQVKAHYDRQDAAQH